MTVQDKPGRDDSRALMWLGHNSIRVTAVYAATIIGYNAAGAPGFLTWPAAAVSVMWIVSVLAEVGYHDDRLCEKCIAATPLDPQAAVSRWKPALHARHTPRLGLMLVLLIVTGTVAPLLTSVHHPPWWVYAANIAVVLGTAAYFLVLHVHRKLYPWCPWCRWEGGGSEEISPDVPKVPQEL